MSLTNNLKTIIDLPVWEWMRFSPVTSAAGSCAAGDWEAYYVGGTPRYTYYANAGVLYRYDTYTDSWHQLATCPNTSSYVGAIMYYPGQGYYGKAIGPGPTTNTIQMAALTGNTLVGNKIFIYAGTGVGQERTITAVAEPVVHDSGFVTTNTPGPPASITDATTGITVKTWKWSQWRDYQTRIIFGTGQNQVRRILYNTTNALVITDYNYACIQPWYSPTFATAPGSAATFYQIESSIVTVNSPWVTQPDNTSRFVVKGGGLWYTTGNSGSPYYSLSYYDILADIWYLKGSQTGFLSSTLSGYDIAAEGSEEAEGGVTTDGVYATSLTSTVGAISVAAAPYNTRTLIDASQNMPVNKYANMMIRLAGGTGRGQVRTIIANNTTTFIIGRDWDVIPDSTTTYQVIGDTDKLLISPARGVSVLGQYSMESDVMTQGRQFDYGVARSFIAQSVSTGIYTLTIAAAGTGYQVNDILTLGPTGTGGTVKVLTVNTGASNAVTSVALLTPGTGYTLGIYSTTDSPANGSGCTITVTALVPLQPAIGVTGIAKTAGGLLSVSVNVAGSNYNVGDLITCSTGGTGGVLRVTGVTATGGVSSVTIEAPGGTTYAPGASSTSATTVHNAAATGCTITINSITGVATATTGINHNFTIGDTVVIGGCDSLVTNTSSTYYGGVRVVTGVPTLTTFTYNLPSLAQITYTVTGSVISNLTGYTVAGVNYTTGTGMATISVGSGGSGYAIGDLLQVAGGTGGIVKVATLSGSAVATVTIMAFGFGYAASTQNTVNIGNSPTATTGGSSILGSGCTITIGSIGQVYSISAAGNALIAVTGVDANGGITSAVIVNGGTGYTNGTLTVAAQGNGAIFNAEALSTILLIDTTKNWQPNELVGKTLVTCSGGPATTAQIRRIIANTNHSISFALALSGSPTSGASKYVIHDPKALGTESTNKSDPRQYAWGVATGGSPTTLIDNPSGLGTIAVVVGGTGYSVNDVLTLDTGTGGTVKVTAVNSGIVTGVSIVTPGTNYPAGSTCGVSGGGGSACTIIVTNLNSKNWYVNQWAGKKVKILAGTGVNANPNEIYISSNTANTLTVSGLNTVTVAVGGSSYVVGDVLTLTNSPLTVTGGTVKVTSVNSGAVTGLSVQTLGAGFVGSTVYITTGGTGSACTVTVNSIQALGFTPDATTVYAIMDNWGTASGAGMLTYTVTAGGANYNIGDIIILAQGQGGANTVVKVLAVNAGAVTSVQILQYGSGLTASTTYSTTCLTSTGTGCTLTPNTITTATSGTVLNDPFQNWGAGAASGALVTKNVRFLSGSNPATEYAITSVVGTQLTYASGNIADGNTQYSVYGVSTRGGASAGSSLIRLYGTSVIDKCRYILSWRGNATPTIERYDITQDMWEYIAQSPITETYSTGSMYAYNGKDRIYFTKDITGRVMYYDLIKNIIVPCSTVPYGMNTAIQGNKMFTISTTDLLGSNLEYLYILRHTGTEMWRVLVYW